MAAPITRRLSNFILPRNNNVVHFFVCRTLLSDADIKLEGFQRQRIFITDLLGPAGKASLMNKLIDVKTPKEAKHICFGIADFMHLAETNQELAELERVFKLISVHDDIEKSLTFGATLLRLYHHLGMPDRAYRLYKDPVCKVLLSDNTCHKVLMDLLYKHGQYQLVADVYTGLQNFNIDCVTLVFGAFYHINTPASCEAAENLVKDLLQEYTLSKRALLYVVMLSLNQNKPDAALEMLKMFKADNLVLNVKLMCYAKLGQIPDIFKGLDEAIKRANDMSRPLNTRLYSDTMRDVRQAINSSANQRHLQKFNKIEQELSSLGALSPQKVVFYVDRTIFGQRSNAKQSGKPGIMQAEQ
ncbi:hypothetical protein BsWGS_01170 [Bradybaena similaris]